MKTLLSLAVIFLLLSCADDNGDDQDKITIDQVTEIDLYGAWHHKNYKRISFGKEIEYNKNDTLDLEDNKNIKWYGITSGLLYEESHSFTGINCCWNLDEANQKLSIVAYANVINEKGDSIAFLENHFQGTITNFTGTKFELTNEWETEDGNGESKTMTFVR